MSATELFRTNTNESPTTPVASMLDAFKIKPYDLEPTFASWKDAPQFTGNTKKDTLSVDEWLKTIKAGCVERNVPKEYWHKVGQHYMGEKARSRLNELKGVMAKVHGGNYRWNWEKFKIAMRNMGWNIEDSATETIKVKSKPSGLWWISGRETKEKEATENTKPGLSGVQQSQACPPQRPKPRRRSESSFWVGRKPSTDRDNKESENQKTKDEKENVTVAPSRPPPVRSSTGFWSIRKKNSQDAFTLVEEPEQISSSVRPTTTKKSHSDSTVMTVRDTSKPPMPTPTRRDSNADEATVTTITHAPLWLINACNALDFLQTEHPKVMSTISAILITAGTLPSIPALTAGAGGALLASGAAQAAGAIAVGVGSWLKAQQEARSGGTAAGQQSEIPSK
ncbi:hypothetical protein E1B28_013385 [Marasmius oreades]|uniref:Uncharacterized protein n=1 Tax=Marasmius oreades TaxID=181124 RepID=A0A9P7RPR5_9AGAR|nr:uncharacterized protein E1B28_013385 [Marasmius oreades]KAG7087417.1 hypothetical protein E1B28_013385 [Marasmius oreades]